MKKRLLVANRHRSDFRGNSELLRPSFKFDQVESEREIFNILKSGLSHMISGINKKIKESRLQAFFKKDQFTSRVRRSRFNQVDIR